jgi:uncharacterized protein (TIGR03086 family)
MTAPLDVDLLQRSCDIADRTMSGVGPEQLHDPTPCGEWNVCELMEHMVASTDFFADAAEHGAVADDRDWPEYEPSQLPAAHRDQLQRLMQAYRAPGVMDRPMTILAGPPRADFCLAVAISERLVHAWDLATATAQRIGEDGTAIAEALLACPDYTAVNDEVRHNDPPPFAPEVTLAPDADALDRLVAFLGRDPGLDRRSAIAP